MIEAIILGILQGLTEFLPVSSSAHLILAPWFFKWQGMVDTLSFDVALHFGTLLALLFYFRQDWIEILKSTTKKDGMIWKLAIGTLPAAVFGILLHDWIEQNRSPVIIAFTLCFVSVLMLLSEHNYKKSERFGIEKITFKDALFIGIAQVFALIPGVSRSGITIIAGIAKKLKRDDAARFSFLLATPAVAGASLLESGNLIGAENIDAGLLVAGILVSAAVGYIAIKYLIIFLHSYSLRPFAYYRFLLAFVIIFSIWKNG
jgi:undecaprenyl-diphosphatase